jgi:iron complex outermembrane receptor protein
VLSLAALALAQATGTAAASEDDGDLSRLSIEDLMEIEVTSFSKHAQRLSETPAAVTVLTGEDIRRSGMTTVPDALRMVPGLHVANIDASTWAITSRGFNSQFANKLLVMIDGRSVYTPLFSGVYWDVQDLVLEDIDRVEVIRGPGGTVWGANAVNGVINIITKEAKETQGLLVSSAAGSHERAIGAGRWGGAIGDDAHYRAYVKYSKRTEFDDGRLGRANDDTETIRGGFRTDWSLTPDDTLTVQGDYYDGTSGETQLTTAQSDSDVSGGNVLARWSHEFSEDSHLRAQLYYDRTARYGNLLDEERDTVDLELQHRLRPHPRHDVVWGAGYRMTSDDVDSSGFVAFDPESRTVHLANAFVQDQITLIQDRLRLTLGTKLEHNDYSGFEVQPSARVLWTPHERHAFWGAISRAVRTPSRAENDVALLVPQSPTVFSLLAGSGSFDSEDLLAFEAGYRSRPIDAVSIDLATYYNLYEDLRSLEPGPVIPDFPFPGATTLSFSGENRYDGVGYGVELSATWDPTEYWRLTAGYTFMKVRMDRRGDSLDFASESQEEDTPTDQVHFLSRLDLPWHLQFDTSLYYVDAVENQDIPSYVRLDLRLGWQPRPGIDVSLVGQNLAEARHLEFGPSFTRLPTQVPRSVYGRVTWRY